MKPIINLISLNLTEKEISRFYEKFDTGNPDDCWQYKDGPDTWGYGRFSIRSGPRVRIQAHRMAFFLKWKIDPGEWKICHECDNPICVNWNHLFVGTQDDNMKDKIRKRRQARGETNGWSKLTNADVLEIRLRCKARLQKHAQIAQDYGVSTSTVAHIACRSRWKNIE